MTNLINQNILRRELRRIIKEELEKRVPESQVNSLWEYLNKLHERLKILEKN